jgi:hypothetical protein
MDGASFITIGIATGDHNNLSATGWLSARIASFRARRPLGADTRAPHFLLGSAASHASLATSTSLVKAGPTPAFMLARVLA